MVHTHSHIKPCVFTALNDTEVAISFTVNLIEMSTGEDPIHSLKISVSSTRGKLNGRSRSEGHLNVGSD